MRHHSTFIGAGLCLALGGFVHEAHAQAQGDERYYHCRVRTDDPDKVYLTKVFDGPAAKGFDYASETESRIKARKAVVGKFTAYALRAHGTDDVKCYGPRPRKKTNSSRNVIKGSRGVPVIEIGWTFDGSAPAEEVKSAKPVREASKLKKRERPKVEQTRRQESPSAGSGRGVVCISCPLTEEQLAEQRRAREKRERDADWERQLREYRKKREAHEAKLEAHEAAMRDYEKDLKHHEIAIEEAKQAQADYAAKKAAAEAAEERYRQQLEAYRKQFEGD